MVEIAIPQFADGVADEFSSGAFGSFIGGKVGGEDGILGLAAGTDEHKALPVWAGYAGGRTNPTWWCMRWLA